MRLLAPIRNMQRCAKIFFNELTNEYEAYEASDYYWLDVRTERYLIAKSFSREILESKLVCMGYREIDVIEKGLFKR